MRLQLISCLLAFTFSCGSAGSGDGDADSGREDAGGPDDGGPTDAECADDDGDGVCDADDVCADGDDTADADGDDVPDACDICASGDDALDTDDDGVPNACDVCDGDDADDADGDGAPDDCDICAGFADGDDADADGVPDGCDICPMSGDPTDTDADGVPDACDACEGYDDAMDEDDDTVPDDCDVCDGGDDTEDTDADGVPDDCDICEGGDDATDADLDGTPDDCDVCPNLYNTGDAASSCAPSLVFLVDADATGYACGETLTWPDLIGNRQGRLLAGSVGMTSFGTVGCEFSSGWLEGPPHALNVGGSEDFLWVHYLYQESLNPPAFTIETWTRVEGSPGAPRAAVSSADEGNRLGYAIYANAANAWTFWIGLGSAWSRIGGPSVRIGEWVHTVGTYDGTTQSFYVNGRLVATQEVTMALNDRGPFRIGSGASAGPASNPFDGSVGQVALYNEAHDEATILQRYLAVKPRFDPERVVLTNATALASETDFPVDEAINGFIADPGTVGDGWADTVAGITSANTASFETLEDTPDFGGTARLTIVMHQMYRRRSIGRFRWAATTADRADFADGLADGGAIGDPAIWNTLTVVSATASNGTVLTPQPDGSILASGTVPVSEVYTLTFDTDLVGITGLRLEALEDPSLPTDGPGRETDGNFVLSDVDVTIAQAP